MGQCIPGLDCDLSSVCFAVSYAAGCVFERHGCDSLLIGVGNRSRRGSTGRACSAFADTGC